MENAPKSGARYEHWMPVTVYWDFENCPVPPDMKGFQVVNAIRTYIKSTNGILKNISAFGNLVHLKQELRSQLQQLGVLLHDVSSGKPSASDMALMVEFLKLACDHPPPHHIVLISGDRDFSNVLNVLVFRGYELTLIHSSDASEVLKSAATTNIEWRTFLGVSNGPTTVSNGGSPGVSHNSPTPPKRASPPPLQSQFIMDTSSVFVPQSQMNGVHKSQSSEDVAMSGVVLTDSEKQSRSLLIAVLQWLKKEFFKPTETIIQNACKRECKKSDKYFSISMWQDILSVAQKDPSFLVLGQSPNRVIFLASDVFPGIEPSEPPKKPFTENIWIDLLAFIRKVHPKNKQGRFGFANYLRDEGPPSIKIMPLAKIAQLVQVAVNHGYLKFNGSILKTVDLDNPNASSNASQLLLQSVDEEKLKQYIIQYVQRSHRVQIGSLSSYLQKCGVLPHLQERGGFKRFLEKTGLVVLEKDDNNGLYIKLKPSITQQSFFTQSHPLPPPDKVPQVPRMYKIIENGVVNSMLNGDNNNEHIDSVDAEDDQQLPADIIKDYMLDTKEEEGDE